MKGLQRYEKENKFIDWMKQSDSINDCKKPFYITRFSLSQVIQKM